MPHVVVRPVMNLAAGHSPSLQNDQQYNHQQWRGAQISGLSRRSLCVSLIHTGVWLMEMERIQVHWDGALIGRGGSWVGGGGGLVKRQDKIRGYHGTI